MSTKKQDKLKSLLQLWPMHTIATSRWLSKQGMTYDNLERYERSGWVRRVGSGAFQRASDNVSWEGAVFGLQNQHPTQFYIGGRTALELQGAAHFLPLGQPRVFLFSSSRKQLPLWFANYIQALDVHYTYLQYRFLPPQLALTFYDCGEFKIEVSTRERAALEVLELLGRLHTLEECRLLFENLGTLRPKVVQDLLEGCSSIKAKRVFLFLTKNLGHRWFKDLDLSRINLGSGPRDLVPGGVYDPEFQLTYPKGFFDDDRLEV
jgi:Transcriptional regulator, AbiEi antitoxin, Type IV TA system/Transcriptional regulator, AbiEi antitoxin N-terminal domain